MRASFRIGAVTCVRGTVRVWRHRAVAVIEAGVT